MLTKRKEFLTKEKTLKYLKFHWGIEMSERTLDRRRKESKLKYLKDKSNGRIYIERSDIDKFVSDSLKEEVNVELMAEEILSGK
jgi:hypothetical protein